MWWTWPWFIVKLIKFDLCIIWNWLIWILGWVRIGLLLANELLELNVVLLVYLLGMHIHKTIHNNLDWRQICLRCNAQKMCILVFLKENVSWQILHYTKQLLLKNYFFMFLVDLILDVSFLRMHPAVHLHTSKALTSLKPKRKVY